MSVNLQKGQKVDLTKGNSGLRRVMAGLGWDAAGQTGGFFGGRTQNIDCDAIAFLLNSDGKLESSADVVFFNNLRHMSGCVLHQGDNLTGEGEGDDEQIMVDLANLPAKYERVVILVSIYKATDKGQHFGMIKNAFIRLVDADRNNEICIYNLTENAIKFVNKNGTLFLAVDSDAEMVHVHLRNSGDGLTEEEIQHVFERFYKTDESRGLDTTGVGLGLSIVSRIMVLHSGKVTVKSVKGEYTEFIVSVPLRQYEQDD